MEGGSGGPQLSTMYFLDTGILTAQDAATAVRDFWGTCVTVMHTSYTVNVESEVLVIDSTTGKPTSAVGTTNAPLAGLESGDPLPWATQGLIEWATGVYINGRQVRGRTFIPGPVETENTGGTPIAPYRTALNLAASNLVGDVLSDFQIYSRKHKVPEQVSHGAAWAKWAVLTSRRD